MNVTKSNAKKTDVKWLLELMDPYEEVRLAVGTDERDSVVEICGHAHDLLDCLPDSMLDRAPGGITAEVCDNTVSGARLTILF